MARAVQGGFFAGRRFYIYSRVDFLKIRGSAALRSKMPACGGQAAGDFLGCGTQAILSGGTKRLCPAILDAEDGKATHGRHSPCLGGWLRAVLKL